MKICDQWSYRAPTPGCEIICSTTGRLAAIEMERHMTTVEYGMDWDGTVPSRLRGLFLGVRKWSCYVMLQFCAALSTLHQISIAKHLATPASVTVLTDSDAVSA